MLLSVVRSGGSAGGRAPSLLKGHMLEGSVECSASEGWRSGELDSIAGGGQAVMGRRRRAKGRVRRRTRTRVVLHPAGGRGDNGRGLTNRLHLPRGRPSTQRATHSSDTWGLTMRCDGAGGRGA